MTTKIVELPPLPQELAALFDARLAPILNDPNRVWGEKIVAIYEYVDSFTPYLARFVSCKRGCSACCRGNVPVTLAEAELISIAYDVPVRQVANVTQEHHDACPFLGEEGACTVYEYRPLACRMLFGIGNAERCMTPAADGYYGQPPVYGNDYWRSVVTWLHMNAHHMASQGYFGDIRDFFVDQPAG